MTATNEETVLADFLPPVAQWFRKAFAGPSPAQVQAWPVIRRGESTLLLAPTGSGKTLSAFLCAIDDLYRRAGEGTLTDTIHVLYVTPLKALGNDIHKNLLLPLEGIREAAGGELPELRVAVRTGDTPAAERARMVRQPPHILITTPESLYLLLQSNSMAPALRGVRTVIVDEVHALCASKRGAHLSVSLERLAAHVDGPLQRVGCSATLRPLEEIAAYLVGYEADGTQRPCTIVNAGMRKDLDVQVMAPLPDFLEAGNTALWASAYELLQREIAAHRTTLIFCNSRYKAERTVLRLRELAPEGRSVGVHHGSMAKELRLAAEDDLKAGRLHALVATASLELGIDVGAVDLVYQLESPRSVATGLQRIGRAGHLLHATSKGRLLLFDRDELLEAAAIVKAMSDGQVDAIRIPRCPLDVLAQQVAGAVAAGDQLADTLYALVRQSYPYRALPRGQFDAVLRMLAGEYPFGTAHPPRALLLWDRPTGRLTPARTTAHVTAMNVGTIAENAEYEVVIERTKRRVGAVQAEFVDDSLRVGDVFLLGSTTWKMVGVRRNQLLVEEAPGVPPTVPWWLGPVESRTVEVGRAVGALRRAVAARLHDPDLLTWLGREYHLCPDAAIAVADYVREQQAAAGTVPDHEALLVESWRDELGRTHLIIHTPYGHRLNRTWGVALATAAKRQYHQEWSVTATNDIILLSHGAENAGTPVAPEVLLAAVTPENLADLLTESVSGAALGSSAFREVAVCSLQILRAWQGKRVPLWLQTHRAGELYEVAREQWEYPVIGELIRAYLQDTLDAPGLADLLGEVAAGTVQLTFRACESPSPLAHGALTLDRYGDHQMGRDRRAYLLRLHRQVLQEVLSAEQMAALLDQRAIDGLERRLLRRSEATRARNSDELAQAIRELGDVPATLEGLDEIVEGDPAAMLAPLVAERRVVGVRLPDAETGIRLVPADLWRQYHDAFAHHGKGPAPLRPVVEHATLVNFTGLAPCEAIPAAYRKPIPQAEARGAIVERYLRCRGPVTPYEIANATGWTVSAVEEILDGLVAAGKVARGSYSRQKPHPQWVNKANLEEIHRLTMGYLKRELEACAPYEVVDFITRWQHLHPATRVQGLAGLRQVIQQLQGLEIMQSALETEVLPGRVADYAPKMLDRLIAAGEVRWCRVSPQRLRRGVVTLCARGDMAWLAGAESPEYDGLSTADVDIPDTIAAVRAYFQQHGTAYFDDLLADVGLEEGAAWRSLWHLAWCGELTCDTYECLRHANFTTTLSACYDLDSTPQKIVQGRMTQERVIKAMARRRLDPRQGRWCATPRLVPPTTPLPAKEVVERWAEQLLRRWGIVTRDILAMEVAAPSWAALAPVFKRMELLGQVNRGYFIESHQGEQYGLPAAVELLRDCRARRGDGRALGYLPDEPVFTLTNREPANLYVSGLAIIEERGQPLKLGQRSGNLTHRLVAQAGQVLIYQGRQLVTLTRAQLECCLRALQHDYAGQPVELRYHRWNGHPMEASPIRPLLTYLGFRLDGRGEMVWPPKKPATVPAEEIVETFVPYYEETHPPQDGRAQTLEKVSTQIRPVLQRLIETFEAELSAERWTYHWNERYMSINYHRGGKVWIHIGKSFVRLIINPPNRKVDGKRQRYVKGLRYATMEEVNDEAMAHLRTILHAAEAWADLAAAKQ